MILALSILCPDVLSVKSGKGRSNGLHGKGCELVREECPMNGNGQHCIPPALRRTMTVAPPSSTSRDRRKGRSGLSSAPKAADYRSSALLTLYVL